MIKEMKTFLLRNLHWVLRLPKYTHYEGFQWQQKTSILIARHILNFNLPIP